MKRLIQLTLLLLISVSVNSKTTCLSTCPAKKVQITEVKTISTGVDENDWILNTRFKY